MRKALADPPARKKILEAARNLFLEKGYEGASVDEICSAAKLTKGSFFHYFKSKDEVCVAALDQYQNDMKATFTACTCSEAKDPLERIYGFLDGLKKAFKDSAGGGCFMGAMAQELSDTHPAIRKMCGAGFDGIIAFLEKDLAAAKAKYAPKSSIDPKGLAAHFVAVVQGSMLISRVRKDGRIKTDEIGHYKEYLKRLFGC